MKIQASYEQKSRKARIAVFWRLQQWIAVIALNWRPAVK
jgi:hypothetical protein